jgi:hypothetical protein
LWLSALAHATRAAAVLGDTQASERYRAVLEKAALTFEEKLWNGEYYRLYNDKGGARGDTDEGCLTDQIIGEWTAHLVGLGNFLQPPHVKSALRTIMRLSYRPDYGLLNCRWPQDGFLHDVDKNCWSDQANTCWTGVELAFASFLLYRGLSREALAIIRNVDGRYRNAGRYFDHQEFGGHYYRAMSAWAIVNGALGLSIEDDRYGFAPCLPGASQRVFFSYGGGTAVYRRTVSARAETVSVQVETGTFRCRELNLGLAGRASGNVRIDVDRTPLSSSSFDSVFVGRKATIEFRRPLRVRAGSVLSVRLGR